MASFRDSSITKSASAHTIVFTIPALAVAGDLLVCFVSKSQNGPYNYHEDWQTLDIDNWGIGSRLSSTSMWKIATAADIIAGSWTIDCSPSSSVGKTDVLVVAYDITDWSGLVQNFSTDGYTEGTVASTFVTPAADYFTDGITITSLSHRLVSRTGPGSCDQGALRVEADAADTAGVQVYDTVGDIAATAALSTVSGLGDANTYHVIAVAFGPAGAGGDLPPCPDAPDGVRVDL